jgi:hypothetical protein
MPCSAGRTTILSVRDATDRQQMGTKSAPRENPGAESRSATLVPEEGLEPPTRGL